MNKKKRAYRRQGMEKQLLVFGQAEHGGESAEHDGFALAGFHLRQVTLLDGRTRFLDARVLGGV